VSNPPYIALDDPHLLQGDCRFEPSLALVAGDDGLQAIQCIATEAAKYLDTNGLLALEHGYDQGEKVRNLLKGLGYRNVVTVRDLEKRERVTSGIGGGWSG
jgi:release factor glutamine methyltransferase